MIEINLLPGARRATKSRSAKIDFKAVFSDMKSRVNDVWLLATIGIVVFSAIGTAGMWWYDTKRVAETTAAELKAKGDSARYANVIKERARSEAARDSVIRQVRIINAIDGGRYVWPHILDEVSKTLPPYTWLVSIAQTSVVPTLISELEAGLILPKDGTPIAAEADSAVRVAQSVLRIRLVGQTVDIQAITRFMKLLEQSDFIEGVQLTKNEEINLQPMNKQAFQFTLDFQYSKPDSTRIRRVPLTVAVR